MIDALAVLGHYWKARYRRPFRSREELRRWQTRSFARLAERVLVRSPFYRPYVGRPLAEYPIVDKATMMEAFDAMNTRGLVRDRLMELALRAEETRDFTPTAGEIAVGLSSGTSGRRGLFVTSRRERQVYAGTVLAKGLPESLFAGHRVALLLRANNPLYESTAGGRVTFRFFDLLSCFPDLLAGLAAYAPTIVVGPPQALRLVAEAQKAGQVRLTPAKVIAGAEVLEAAEATVIADAFGRRVDQIYQATEGFLGITCAQGTLHLNEELLLFEREWIDRASGRFLPIVTDLTRSTQPIVRYRLDDVLVESGEACACGSVSTALARIEGRADDILFLESAQGGAWRPVMPDFVRDALSRCRDVVGDYRVVQTGDAEIELQVEGTHAAEAFRVAEAALLGVFDRLGVRRPRLTPGGRIVRRLERKLRRVERRVPRPQGASWLAS